MITAATMFSGIGAPEAAMPHWHWAWCAEIEKFPTAVLAARHPQTANLGDVTTNDFCERAAAIARPDVLVFGSPCQSFSVAGRRLGLDDPRGNLALHALAIVGQLRPRWFVFENVPGLLSSDKGRDFGLFLRAVDELGYSACWAMLDAQWFGVAQRRKRVFVVGHSGDWRRAAAVLLEPESVCGNYPPRRQAGQGPAPTIASRASAGGGLGTDFDCDGGLIQQTYRLFTANDDVIDAAKAVSVAATLNSSCERMGNTGTQLVARALTAHPARIDGETETFVTHDRSHANAGVMPAIAFDTTQITSNANRSQPRAGDPCHPLAAGAHAPAVAFAQNQLGEVRLGECFNTLNTNSNASGRNTPLAFQTRSSNLDIGDISGTFGSNSDRASGSAPMFASSAVRRLTPRECERLQGFPDDYTLITYRGKPAADGPRYKSLGNSMCVNVMRWILARIEAVERLQKQ